MKKTRPRNRRRKASATARLRPFWIPIAVVALLLAGGAGFAIAWPGFEPGSIDVIGNRIVPRADILARAAIAPHVNMWLQSSAAIGRRVEAIPYIAAAHVYRLPPATIVIGVAERTPFAVVRSATQSALVDRDLRVLELDPSVGSTLPQFVLVKPSDDFELGTFLSTPDVLAMRDDYDTMIAAHVVPVRLTFDRFGGLVATMRGGVRVLLGDDAELAKTLPLVDPILAQVVRKQRRVAAVDLRAPATPVIVFK